MYVLRAWIHAIQPRFDRRGRFQRRDERNPTVLARPDDVLGGLGADQHGQVVVQQSLRASGLLRRKRHDA